MVSKGADAQAARGLRGAALGLDHLGGPVGVAHDTGAEIWPGNVCSVAVDRDPSASNNELVSEGHSVCGKTRQCIPRSARATHN